MGSVGRAGFPPLPSRRLVRTDWWHLSDGEIHYVWWFVQGSIMEPDVRRRLRRAWGMCQRHAWGAIAAEAAFRQNSFHGPAILYHDLMERAHRALATAGPWVAPRASRRLGPSGPCLMCAMGFSAGSAGIVKPELVERGRDLTMIREFAADTRRYWEPTVCGACVGDGAPARCRPHLIEAARYGRGNDLAVDRALVADVLARLSTYAQSFRWECRGTDTDRDRAALLSAVGWCSGWKAGLAFIA